MDTGPGNSCNPLPLLHAKSHQKGLLAAHKRSPLQERCHASIHAIVVPRSFPPRPPFPISRASFYCRFNCDRSSSSTMAASTWPWAGGSTATLGRPMRSALQMALTQPCWLSCDSDIMCIRDKATVATGCRHCVCDHRSTNSSRGLCTQLERHAAGARRRTDRKRCTRSRCYYYALLIATPPPGSSSARKASRCHIPIMAIHRHEDNARTIGHFRRRRPRASTNT